jgi:cadmium resistance protein CadD (predicted permease)
MFAFIFYLLFSRTDRRDKIYSSLFGWFLGLAIGILLLKFTNIKDMLPPEAIQ